MLPANRSAFDESRAKLERAIREHSDVEVRNLEWVGSNSPHTVAMCDALAAMIRAFNDRKMFVVLEAEIARLGRRARPEDFVAWIEAVGVFVIEVKSHSIDGIARFEGGVPQVIYGGRGRGDKDLLEQPRAFAFDLRSELEVQLDVEDSELPALYFAGWLPNVSPAEVSTRKGEVPRDRVWLCDMLDRTTFLERLGCMKNVTRGDGARRDQLPNFAASFGCSSGLRVTERPRPATPGTLAQLIDERERVISALTPEQESLAFNPNLVRGPKVIRGVVGSGKTVVLANAVADQFLRSAATATGPQPKVLVLCYNVSLVPYLRTLIARCFDHRKTDAALSIPPSCLDVVNIDKLAWRLLGRRRQPKRWDASTISETVDELIKTGRIPRQEYDAVFIDEAQDLDLAWYPLIRELARPTPEGPSIVVFYDDAQNVYGARRPGSGPDVPTWTDLLGTNPNPRGLPTVMRVAHRNTNEVLTFSFALLLGSYATKDPKMAVFTNLAEFKNIEIPNEPRLNHPNAGRPCVEALGPRHYQVNFAVHSGPVPSVHREQSRGELIRKLVSRVRADIDTGGLRPEDVLILAPRRNTVVEIYRAFEDGGFLVHCPLRFQANQENLPTSLSSGADRDPRNLPLQQAGSVTVGTIKSSKGHTAHVVHVAFIDELGGEGERAQRDRAEVHVACTRATTLLYVWGTGGQLLAEAEAARDAVASLR